ncbi:DUF1415 domain-containing protein [Vogesella indigofera]|uniref:DUF1415 domain-containing protein n=1 Tax=Vogesella indigofera TaxID=45465 RepID=A0ABT5I1S0_VOGIN|nr:DUF1415 domain-containing protein [Vogesella indigofera]MDC7690121.1 DUF1415 domain-containing protein [Vogesella indigofera]
MNSTDQDAILDATRRWLENAVIGLNLCPFAKSVYVKNQVRIIVSEARDPATLLEQLMLELRLLQETDPQEIDTTLLVHPHTLQRFLDFNDFLEIVDAAVADMGLEGEIQVASFHPKFQFADTTVNDISNFTNRSPYPTLHLIRESSIARAVEAFPEAEAIFERNIEVLEELGHAGWAALDVGPERKQP